ncbi:MAG: DUF2807 domain-containing protein [Chlorobi bacterium]|nr:DUF2807 domain-containing protein [Chlorobiota bacterium]
MNKYKVLLILFFSTIILTSSCRKIFYDCIRGNNIIASEERNTGNFNSITSAGNFYVFVSYDSISSIEINAEENLIPYINTYTKNETLHLEIQDNRCIRENQQINVYIKTPDLEKIQLLGSGLIECTNIESSSFFIDLLGSGNIDVDLTADYIETNVAGSGDIRLSGSTNKTEFNITGSGEIRALNLEQNICFVNITGTGNIYVSVDELLEGEILGSGNIYYIGNPSISIKFLGTGNIYKY